MSAAIAAAFSTGDKRAALMPYMMGGYPGIDASRRIGEACADAGADLLELGIPFSDPLADGPVVHAAATAALAAGATTPAVLEVGRAVAERLPVIAMCYANVVLARGAERFADDLAAHGLSGLIVPDLPLEESDVVRGACDAAGVALVPLVAPTTPPDRMARIGEQGRGFIYAVAVTGTTGERAGIADGLPRLVAAAKASTVLPVAVGFGISSGAQAAAAADAGADGVIVGSLLVRLAGGAGDPAAAVGGAVAELADALR